ncbi:MAG: hypothetical protein HQM06_01905 [Magnetococcales bacterium]|nr:hypothetical protein [Magnetococcales bacterium]
MHTASGPSTTEGEAELSLWVAVLEQAIADLANPKTREPALLWFRSTRKGIGSFIFLADTLNQCPNKLRRQIFTSLRQPIPCMRLAA